MVEYEDKELVRRCLGGDTSAFAILIDRYQRPLFNTALRMTGDYEEARDITQSVFMKVYQKLETYKPEHKFFSWIYRMLVNESINFLNRRDRAQALEPGLVSETKTPADHHHATQLNNQMQEALLELQFDYRMVILLRYFNDMSYKEMSYLLGIPEKTIKSRLYTARRLMAEILLHRGITSHG